MKKTSPVWGNSLPYQTNEGIKIANTFPENGTLQLCYWLLFKFKNILHVNINTLTVDILPIS